MLIKNPSYTPFYWEIDYLFRSAYFTSSFILNDVLADDNDVLNYNHHVDVD